MAEPSVRPTSGSGTPAADRDSSDAPQTDGRPFWESVALDDMSDVQWESLCDGCGRCCLQKLEDEDTGEVHFTSIACRLLDIGTCRCRDYARRFRRVPDCVAVRPLSAQKLAWLPATCAYVRLAAGRELPPWHPLVTGRASSVAEAGISVAHVAHSELDVPVHEWVEHILEWRDAHEDGKEGPSVASADP